MPVLETTDLTKHYKSVTAVDNVSLTVPEGDVYGLLGPNGAGKSTLINILVDFVKPTSGTVTVCGYDAQDEAVAVHRHVGVLPDGFDVFSRLSGRRHLQYVADARGVDIDSEAYLDRVGLGDSGDQNATTYSRGMQQRLGLAMALVGEPDLIVLDEPFAGLDPDGVRLLRSIVAAENDRGATVFLSSHRLNQVERTCTRVGLLSDGQLLAEGTPGQLLADLDDHQQYAVTVASSPEPAASDLAATSVCREVTVDGGDLLVACPDGTDQDELRAVVEATGATVQRVRSVEPRLEDLYAMYAGEQS